MHIRRRRLVWQILDIDRQLTGEHSVGVSGMGMGMGQSKKKYSFVIFVCLLTFCGARLMRVCVLRVS